MYILSTLTAQPNRLIVNLLKLTQVPVKIFLPHICSCSPELDKTFHVILYEKGHFPVCFSEGSQGFNIKAFPLLACAVVTLCYKCYCTLHPVCFISVFF